MDEALTKLIADLKGYADRAALVEAIQREAKPIYQVIFDAGHGAGLAKGKEKVQQLETEKTTAQEQADAAKSKLTEYERDKPDVAKLRESHDAQITELKAKNTEDRKKHREELATALVARDLADLRSALQGLGVMPEYAEVVTERAPIKSRIRYANDGVREVLQLGREVPIAIADGENAVVELAKAILPSVPKNFITSGASAGAGIHSGGAPSAGAPGDGTIYDKIRAEAKRNADIQASQNGNDRAAAVAKTLGVPASK